VGGGFTLFLKDKKGDEKVLSIYWFIILIITVVGIYGMVNAYYRHPYDIRELEANLLINRVADCISYGGEINERVLNKSTGKLSDDFNLNFLDECNITFNTENEHDWNKTEQYYMEINFSDVGFNPLGTIMKGNNVFRGQCEQLKTKIEHELLPKCGHKRFLVISGGKQILIDIFTGIRKTEKNVI